MRLVLSYLWGRTEVDTLDSFEAHAWEDCDEQIYIPGTLPHKLKEGMAHMVVPTSPVHLACCLNIFATEI